MTRLTRSAALGLTILALAATPALADPYFNDPNYPLPDSTSVRQDLRSPDARDAAEGRGTFNAPDVTVVKLPAKSPAPASDGLDWTDAGIGAAGALVLALIAVGGGVAVVRTSRPSRTA
jgi:hypothetical protein